MPAFGCLAGGLDRLLRVDKPPLPKNVIGPSACAVQHTQDEHGIAGNAVCDDVRCSIDDECAGTSDATDATTLRVANQLLHLQTDTVVNGRRRTWAINLNVLEDMYAIFDPQVVHSPASRLARGFAQGGCATFGELSLHLLMRERRT